MEQKIVLVTGATGGIGSAIVKKFAEKKYFVLMHSYSSEKSFALSKEIINNGGNVAPFFANFNLESEINVMFKQISDKYSKIDILINNAGMINRKKFSQFEAEDFQNIFMVNTIAPFLCARRAKWLGCQSIVNIGSIRGFLHQSGTPDYSASKAALHNLTTSLAKAFAPDCRVNCVSPGFIKTNFHKNNLERLDEEAKKTPLKAYGLPEDIAESVYFIASEKSRFTTGSILTVDGGRSCV